MTKYRPGEKVPMSGEYTAYDAKGHNGGSTYLEEGSRFPATQHEGSYYVMNMNKQSLQALACIFYTLFNKKSNRKTRFKK